MLNKQTKKRSRQRDFELPPPKLLPLVAVEIAEGKSIPDEPQRPARAPIPRRSRDCRPSQFLSLPTPKTSSLRKEESRGGPAPGPARYTPRGREICGTCASRLLGGNGGGDADAAARRSSARSRGAVRGCRRRRPAAARRGGAGVWRARIRNPGRQLLARCPNRTVTEKRSIGMRRRDVKSRKLQGTSVCR